ncbi:MAG: hypothetical protein IJT30_09020 [Muribaculaceae bacterium]|nr:hypothetical protein [Muribaculaceae bacterium]
MSKRTYFIIILLLVVVDIVAGFWYLAVRIEAGVDGLDLFQSQADSTQVVAADTISELNVPDVFRSFSRDTFFVSNQLADKAIPTSRFTSVKRIRLRWPEQVNGNDSLPSLERALLEKMFATDRTSLTFAVSQELGKPTFNTTHQVAYHTVAKAPATLSKYSNVSTLLAYPIMTSMRLLVMKVERKRYNGIETTTSAAYVHYDRGLQRVLAKGDIFDSENDPKLLELINSKIDRLNLEQHLNLSQATQLPTEFMAKRKGILFVFATGVIADPADGPIEVFVDYSDLQTVFTPLFKKLVEDNDGFWDYKPLTVG